MNAPPRTRTAFAAALLIIAARAVSFGGCPEILDTIPAGGKRSGNGVNGATAGEEFKIERPVHTAFLLGFGAGYVRHPGFESASYDFFAAFLWEVVRYGALRAAGQAVTDFREAVVADATAGFNVYPFTYGTTPYLGLEAGFGYVRTGNGNAPGALGAAEIGVFAIKISNILLASSARVTYMRAGPEGRNPWIVMIRIGILA